MAGHLVGPEGGQSQLDGRGRPLRRRQVGEVARRLAAAAGGEGQGGALARSFVGGPDLGLCGGVAAS
ncbi:hypothetical protein [Georgenia sp. SUBG003]|uniref:hypothetical protein n=1 Tax=Georgenia sp. SUBG003 TaxID=1497974 RepID=UPI003AB62E5D